MATARAAWAAPAIAALAAMGVPAQETSLEEPPLFSFAWISDMHLDGGKEDLVAAGLRAADEQKPHFVLITGDNNARPAPEDLNRPEPLSLRRQRFLKDFLDRHLRSPRVILPGDNWPQDFDEVFGPMQFGFDTGGIRFLLLAADRRCSARGAEGLAAFEPATLEWLRGDLENNRGKPVLLALHEPIYPPTFLDAPRLRELIRPHANVIAVLQGHLHVEMDWNVDGRWYLVAPMLGAPEAPRFRLVRIFSSLISLRTLGRRREDGIFVTIGRERRIEIPRTLRQGLTSPSGGFEMRNFSCVPAHPLVEDPTLAGRRGELEEIFRCFLLEGRKPPQEKGENR